MNWVKLRSGAPNSMKSSATARPWTPSAMIAKSRVRAKTTATMPIAAEQHDAPLVEGQRRRVGQRRNPADHPERHHQRDEQQGEDHDEIELEPAVMERARVVAPAKRISPNITPSNARSKLNPDAV